MDKYVGKPEGRVSFDSEYYDSACLKQTLLALVDILINDKYQVLIKNEDGTIIVDYCYDQNMMDYGSDRFMCVTYDGQELLYSSEYDEEETNYKQKALKLNCGRFKWDTCTKDQIDYLSKQIDICDDEKAEIEKEMESY